MKFYDRKTTYARKPILSVKYCLPVPVFHFWPKLQRTLQRGLSAIPEHFVFFCYAVTQVRLSFVQYRITYLLNHVYNLFSVYVVGSRDPDPQYIGLDHSVSTTPVYMTVNSGQTTSRDGNYEHLT